MLCQPANGINAEQANSDSILPAVPQLNPQYRQQQKQQLALIAGDKTAEEPELGGGKAARPVLSAPYPVETCCPRLLELFPDKLGLFVAGRPRNYAYRANKIAVGDTVSHLGYRVLDYSIQREEQSVIAENAELAETEADEEAATEAADAAAEKLASELAAMPESTMSFVFLKPQKLAWSCVGNCLIFEPYHQPSLFASDKWNMARILSRKANKSGLKFFDSAGAEFNYRRFTMYTVNPGLAGRQQMIKHLDDNPGVYILKRTNSSQGIGIHMYQAKQSNSVELLQRCIGRRARLHRYVLQKYIERPLLIDKRKFDLRVYLLVLSCSCPGQPGERGYFAFCHPGYVKVSSRAYSGDSRDPRVHFTNQFVQRRGGRQYESVKEATTWLPDELDSYLERRRRSSSGSGPGVAVPEGWCRQKLYRQVQAIAGYLAWSCRPYLASRRPGCVFRIYGPDLIIDEDLRVSLLEFNCFPCYAKNTTALATSLGSMWREAVAIATEASLRFRERLPVVAPVTGRNFRLVFSSQNPNVLGKLISSCYP